MSRSSCGAQFSFALFALVFGACGGKATSRDADAPRPGTGDASATGAAGTSGAAGAAGVGGAAGTKGAAGTGAAGTGAAGTGAPAGAAGTGGGVSGGAGAGPDGGAASDGPLSTAPLPTRQPISFWTIPVTDQQKAPASAGGPVCYASGWCWSYPLPLGGKLAVAALGANDVWAVGEHGTTRHFDGTTWTTVPAPTTVDLRVVWGASPNAVWASGDEGVIKWDGAKWSAVVTDPPLGGDLLTGRSATDVWLGGTGKGISHFDGQSWAPVVGVGSPHDLYELADGGLFAIIDGFDLSLSYKPTTGAFKSLARTVNHTEPVSVWAASTTDVWVAHGFGLYRFDGTDWAQPLVSFQLSGDAPQLRQVRGVDANNVWVASLDGSMVRWNGTKLERWRSGGAYLEHVSARAANDVWASGWAGSLVRFDGSSWQRHFSGTQMLGIRAMGPAGPDEVWAVGGTWSILGANATTLAIRNRAATGWQDVPSTPPFGFITDLWGAKGDDVWVTGLNATHTGPLVAHWDGSAWAHATGLAADEAMDSVWGAAADDVWFAGTNLRHWNGAAFTNVTVPGGPFARSRVAGSGKNDVWFAGATANGTLTIVQWNGTKWTDRSGAPSNVDGLAVRGPNDAFAWSDEKVWWWNGTTWTSIWDGESSDLSFHSVAARTGELWLVKHSGAVEVWNGTKWTASDRLPYGTTNVVATAKDVWIGTDDQGAGILRLPR